MDDTVRRRRDGIYEETLGEQWRGEYSESPDTGLWVATIYRHDTSEWRKHGFASLEDARQAAREYYDAL